MPRTTHVRLVLASLVVAAASLWAVPAADAGGGPPPAGLFEVEAVYINCVDDEVDEPGIDGEALVRVRVTNNSTQDVVVSDGSWQLATASETFATGGFITPADLDIGATWEQVVRIPGGTGPAAFRGTTDVTGPGGTTTLVLPTLDVPGNCPQPDTETSTTSEPVPTSTGDVVTARPRFTG